MTHLIGMRESENGVTLGGRAPERERKVKKDRQFMYVTKAADTALVPKIPGTQGPEKVELNIGPRVVQA